jgi:hypothetical protein
MTSQWPNSAMSSTEPVLMKRPDDVQAVIRRLNTLAVDGLVPMFDPEKQLFCYTLQRTPAGMVRQGISPRYTAITLMGLHRLEQSGGTSPIDMKRVLEVLIANSEWIDNVGDLGLLMWACALVAPDRLEEVDRRYDIKNALTRFRDAGLGHTMHLSWFLTGLSHQALARPEKAAGTRDLAVETYRIIKQNQGKQGIFAHVAGNKGLAGMIRAGMGSFADQVYPIYAMSKFSLAYGDDEATKKALDCALAICKAQGSLGQWWWHYDSSNGQVVETFPVFSVHQHAMGPMALIALGEAIQSDFSPWIYKGLEWIEDNELGINVRDDSANVVWRCIGRTKPYRYWNLAVNALTGREDRESRTRNGLITLFECRPYELGWLLYAFADWNRS